MSGTDPIAQLLAAFGLPASAISNTDTLAGAPLASMSGALGGPPPAAPVIPAAAVAPSLPNAIVGADPLANAVAPLAPAAVAPDPTSVAGPAPSAGGGPTDLQSIISGFLSGFGLPPAAAASGAGLPTGNIGGGLVGGLK